MGKPIAQCWNFPPSMPCFYHQWNRTAMNFCFLFARWFCWPSWLRALRLLSWNGIVNDGLAQQLFAFNTNLWKQTRFLFFCQHIVLHFKMDWWRVFCHISCHIVLPFQMDWGRTFCPLLVFPLSSVHYFAYDDIALHRSFSITSSSQPVSLSLSLSLSL